MKWRTKVLTSDVINGGNTIKKWTKRYLSLFKLKKAIAWLRKFIEWFKMWNPTAVQISQELTWSTQKKQSSGLCSIMHTRKKYLLFRNLERIPKSNSLYPLEPFRDDNDILHVTGRIRHAPVTYENISPYCLVIIMWLDSCWNTHTACLQITREQNMFYFSYKNKILDPESKNTD